jgi:hypothetical protein
MAENSCIYEHISPFQDVLQWPSTLKSNTEDAKEEQGNKKEVKRTQ